MTKKTYDDLDNRTKKKVQNYRLLKDMAKNQQQEFKLFKSFIKQEFDEKTIDASPRQIKKLADELDEQPEWQNSYSQNFQQIMSLLAVEYSTEDHYWKILAKATGQRQNLDVINRLQKALQRQAERELLIGSNYSRVEKDLLKQITLGVVHDLLERFFIKTEPDLRAVPQLVYEIEDELVLAIKENRPRPLQKFYGQEAPKELRGKIRPDSNHTFQNTDQIKQYLIHTLILDY